MEARLVRPTVLTPEAQRIILEALKLGSFLTVACKAAGISPRIYNYWRLRVDRGDPAASRYAGFLLACEKVRAEAETAALAVVRAGEPGWQGAAWFLERRHRQRWGRKSTVRVESDDIDVRSKTDAELRKIVESRGRFHA